MKMQHSLVPLFCALSPLNLVSLSASADEIPPATIFSLVQEKQDVKIVVEQQKDAIGSSPRNIIRSQHDGDIPVVTDVILADEVPAKERSLCGWPG